MNGWEVLKITDGVTAISLLGPVGFRLMNWRPKIAEPKGGGVWNDSPLSDNRRVAFRRWGNVIETFEGGLSDFDQEAVIRDSQDLRRLLEQAVAYWLDDTGSVLPVWIEARASCETSSRYAYIYDYRTPEDGDPYASPFNTGPLFEFDQWQLMLERGHWRSHPPEGFTCLQTTNQQSGYTYGANLVLNPSFETAGGGGADVFLNWTETAGDGAIATEAGTVYHLAASAKLTSGATSNTTLQQNMAVAAGSLYLISFYSYAPDVDYPGRYEIWNNTAGVTISGVEFAEVTTAPAWVKTSLYVTAPAGCVSMGIILHCPDTDTEIAYFDFVNLKLATTRTLGMAATCDPGVYLSNMTSRAQLTDVYTYDAAPAGFSGNLLVAALPYPLFPAAPAAGDIVYFGIDDAAPDCGPFSNIVFDLAAVTPVLVVIWEYWNGGAWFTIPNSYPVPSGGSYWYAGVQAHTWQAPANWVKITVNGIFGYWVRCRISGAVGAAPFPTQQNRQLYNANKPYVTLDGDQIEGELPALSRHAVHGPGSGITPFIQCGMFLWARDLSRGLYFSPFINLSDVQNPSYISVGIVGAALSYVTETQAPTGRAVLYNPAGAGNVTVSAGIVTPQNQSFFGAFRIFARVRQSGGAAGDMSVELTVRSTTSITGERVYTQTTALELLDLGQFIIPSQMLSRSTQALASISFLMTVYNTAGAPGDLYLYDLILLPVDQMAIELRGQSDTSSITAPVEQFAEVDSLFPKQMVSALHVAIANTITFNAGYAVIAGRPAQLSHTTDQMIGVIFLDEFYPHHVCYDVVSFAARYLSMRGNR